MKDSDKNKIGKAMTKSDDSKLTHNQIIRQFGENLQVRYSANVSKTYVTQPRNILNPTFGKEVSK